MSGIHVQVQLRHRSGAPENTFVNTWSFDTAGVASPAEHGAVCIALTDFYTSVQTNTHALSEYYSEVIDPSTDAHRIKTYDLSGAKLSGGVNNPLGAPINDEAFTMAGPSASTPLPSQVAAVLTLEGVGRSVASVELGTPPAVTRPMQRRTGRVYLGPLNAASIYPGVTGDDAVIHPTFQTTMLQAIQGLHDDVQAAGLVGVAVWSRANAALYPLEAASVDLGFDIMRSRKIPGIQRVRVAIT